MFGYNSTINSKQQQADTTVENKLTTEKQTRYNEIYIAYCSECSDIR